MTSAMTGIWIGFIAAGLVFVCGYALLLQPHERALRIATSRVVNAFGEADSVRWVRAVGVVMMLGGLGIGIGALAGLLNNVTILLPY